MQAVATATLAASPQPSAECPPVDLADPAASCSVPTTAVGCRLTSTSTAADQNSNVVVETETNHNHDEADSFNETVSLPSTLTLRLIMQGKEAGSIIGKKGDNVKKFREESGARINISDASCPERIVTISGTTQQIVDAFCMISRRFEEDLQSTNPNRSPATKQLITLRLIMPASQCGSLIGKGGAKIKEIREVAGASIQISGDMLPNSTERLVTVSGSVDAVTRGILQICNVMLECPAKGVTVPYRPKLALAAPVLVAAPGGQTYAVQGQYIIPHSVTPQSYPAAASAGGHVIQYQPIPPQFAKLALQQGVLGQMPPQYAPAPQAYIVPQYPGLSVGGYARPAVGGCPNPGAPAGLIQHHVHEMKIPNDLIGCIIGRGGSKINEIRQLSGANIKIAGVEEGCPDRLVTITGIPESIAIAQHLINASLELHQSLILSGSSAVLDTQTLSSQLALPAPEVMSPEPLVSQAAAVSPGPVHLATAAPQSQPAVAFNQLTQIRSHSLPPSSAVATAPYHQTQIQLGNQVVQPAPVLSVLAYDSTSGTFFDARSGLASKIKGGLTLASLGKTSNKYSPY